jgi:acyl transferase domain-containing protein
MSVSKTVFMFSGQGSQYFQMARELFDRNEVFRQCMLRLDGLAQKLSAPPVIEAIYSGSKADVFDRTLLTHPAIFMIEYSLAQCLMHAGVLPDMTLGASMGSFAAATVAGFIDVEDSMTAVIRQATVLETCCERGGMIAVLADPALFGEMGLGRSCELAAINFASHFAVSARQADLGEIEAALSRRNVTYQRLAVSVAFHSRWMDEGRAPFESFMRSIRHARGRLPLACCEQAEVLTDLPDDYFWRTVRQPIRFRETITRLERDGAHRYIDVGPSGTLATFVKYGLPKTSRSTAHAILTPYGRDQDNLAALLRDQSRPGS